MNPLAERIRALAADYFSDTVSIRRHLHQNPELSFSEHETASYIAENLDGLGFNVYKGIGTTGVVADLPGGNDKPVVALRADIDALPILENTGLTYASQNSGVMHACGHDLHTAGLLGAARILSTIREDIPGSIRLIFQPAEEQVPGGALNMIEDGALDLALGDLGAPGTKPDAIFGLHTWPRSLAGQIGVRPGVFMASNDEINIVVNGQGGHAAEPHQLSADPVFVAAQLVVALQSVISRNCPPDIPSVLSFGSITATGTNNIIPDEATIAGTLRCMGEVWRSEAKRRIAMLVENVAAGFGAEALVEITDGYPLLMNDAQMAGFVSREGVSFLGTEHVEEAPLWFAAEDFAYYLQQVPGAFFLLGVDNKDGSVTGLHTNSYSPDEEALRTGAGFMAHLATAFCFERTAQ